jgi:hypothetical protein
MTESARGSGAGAAESVPRSEESSPAKDRGPDSARAIARRAPSQELVYKRNEAALLPSARDRRAERIARWSDTIGTEIVPLLKAGKVRAAVMNVMQDLAANCIAQRELIDRLEDRVAALEAAAKPRAKAPRRP